MDVDVSRGHSDSKGFSEENQSNPQKCPKESKNVAGFRFCQDASASFHSFKNQDEFLWAMKEDVSFWLNSLFDLTIKSSELMSQLETGVLICRLANLLETFSQKTNQPRDGVLPGKTSDKNSPALSNAQLNNSTSIVHQHRQPVVEILKDGSDVVVYREDAQPGTFQSRDNISNFLSWCRNSLGLKDTVLFETEDLIRGRNERNVILCLLEVARHGYRHGMAVPALIELENEIDNELANELAANVTKEEYEVMEKSNEVEVEKQNKASEENNGQEEREDDDFFSTRVCENEDKTPVQKSNVTDLINKHTRFYLERHFKSALSPVQYVRCEWHKRKRTEELGGRVKRRSDVIRQTDLMDIDEPVNNYVMMPLCWMMLLVLVLILCSTFVA